MSRRRSPQFSIVASWGMWLLSLVLGGALSLAAQQPAAPSTQTSPDSSPTRQQKTPSTDEGSAARLPRPSHDWGQVQIIRQSEYFSALHSRVCFQRCLRPGQERPQRLWPGLGWIWQPLWSRHGPVLQQ